MNPFLDDDAPAPAPARRGDAGQEGFSLILEVYRSRDAAHVTVPEGVTQIMPRAFEGHAEMESVTLPESLMSIGERAFAECASLREVRIPQAVFELGKRVFSGCSSLKLVQLPEGLPRVPEGTFGRCASLERVLGGEEVDRIDASAFFGCASLPGVELLGRAKQVGQGAFSGCRSLRRVELPRVMESVGAEAFRGCQRLEEAALPEEVGSLGRDLFVGCFNLRRIRCDDALVRAFPDAFPRQRAAALGIVRSQDRRVLTREYRRAHAQLIEQLEGERAACEARLRALRVERESLGLLDRARKRTLDVERARERQALQVVRARLAALENPADEELLSQAGGERSCL